MHSGVISGVHPRIMQTHRVENNLKIWYNVYSVWRIKIYLIKVFGGLDQCQKKTKSG